MRRLRSKDVLSGVDIGIISYGIPINISYWWNFGVLAGMCLVVQIITGIVLAMHYGANVEIAFNSVEHIMRDVNNGWFVRYVHANGASMFFIVVYRHIGRGRYYGSYMQPRQRVWEIGVIIRLMMILTSFMGYVRPWGQMSFWAATVITNRISAIPVVGEMIVQWRWGGFSVDNATRNRFFSLHYLRPFVIVGLSRIHRIERHSSGANNPLGIKMEKDKISFRPYYHVKDRYGIIVFIIWYAVFVYWYPNRRGHPDNYIEANAMVTPAHIVPEWYFLPYYAIRRAIPDKRGGVIAMLLSILVRIARPSINTARIRSGGFRPYYKKGYWIFVVNILILGWIGGRPPEAPYTEIGLVITVVYFGFILVYIPMIGIIENIMISAPLKNVKSN